MLQRGHSGDRSVLASTLCKYDLRKGDLFVLSWVLNTFTVPSANNWAVARVASLLFLMK